MEYHKKSFPIILQRVTDENISTPMEIKTEHIEETCVEYFYCVYKNKLAESRFLHGGNVHVSFLKEAKNLFYYDPSFRAAYDLCRDLFFKLVQESRKDESER